MFISIGHPTLIIRVENLPENGDVYLIRKDQIKEPNSVTSAIEVIFGEKRSGIHHDGHLIPWYFSVTKPINDPDHWQDPSKKWYKPSTWKPKK